MNNASTETVSRPVCEATTKGSPFGQPKHGCRYKAEIRFNGKVLCIRHARIAVLERALEIGLVSRMEFK